MAYNGFEHDVSYLKNCSYKKEASAVGAAKYFFLQNIWVNCKFFLILISYYSKKRKENSNYGFLSVFFCMLIVKNTQKIDFEIMKYIEI